MVDFEKQFHQALNLAGADPSPEVHVPADLPAGDYVLGWRWDCEQTSQVSQRGRNPSQSGLAIPLFWSGRTTSSILRHEA